MATTRTAISTATTGDLNAFTRSDNKYTVLGVPADVAPDEIKRAYRRLAMLYHPDRHAGDAKAKAEDVFKRITAAYATLSDPQARVEYDRALARGRVPDLDADARGQRIDPLAKILADILRYEHIFDPHLRRTPKDLHQMVRDALIGNAHREKNPALDKVREEIVGDIPLKEAPGGISFRGDFAGGAIVLTNLRLLVPFWSQLIERQGNTQTTYTWNNLGGVAFPAMRSVTIQLTDRIRGRHQIAIEGHDTSLSLVPKFANLGKLLLLCSLWGIPVIPRNEPTRASDSKRVLLDRPLNGVLVVAVLFALVFLCNACDNGVSDEGSLGILMFGLYVMFATWAALLAWGLFQRFRAYGQPGIEDVLSEAATDA